MKKMLQSDLSCSIATLGHLDPFVIPDAGLPIPVETVRIDLALAQGVRGAIPISKPGPPLPARWCVPVNLLPRPM